MGRGFHHPPIITPPRPTHRAAFNGSRRGAPAIRPIPPGLDTSKYWPMYAVTNNVTEELLRGDVRLNPGGHANATTIVIASNRGKVWSLFDNPFHKRTLLEYGLRPETAIACAFRFLFRPRDEVRDMFQPTWELMANPDALKIGIQIRLGDRVFKANASTHELAWDTIAPYFKCAAEIERTRALPGQAVIYYLMSDSLAVRRMAKQRFGQKLITDVDTPSVHVGCYHGGTCSHEQQVLALRRAVGEIMAYAMADYHVYFKGSGFGRLGAWLSMSWHHHYMVPDNPGVCGGVNSYLDLRADARLRAGV
jgi:hypothetical protein